MFNKSFVLKLDTGLSLSNTKELERYIIDKIEHFSIYDNFSNKEELLNFFHEILDMIDNDLESATFDYTDISDSIGFPYDEKMMIMWYDIIYVMGQIFLNVIDVGGNRLKEALEGQSGPISTSQMIMRAYNELIICKKAENSPAAYGATLIFATLFESQLKSHIEKYYSRKILSYLKDKFSTGEEILDVLDIDLYEFLMFQYGLSNNTEVKLFDAITATKSMKYDLFCKYKVVDSSDTQLCKILTEEITLNQLLRSKYFKEITDIRFQKLVNYLFDSRKLNLRNNLAHCNLSRMNYYSLGTTALLYMLVSMISKEYYLK